MGRAKLRMELRSNKRARLVTFEKRRKGLEKKAYELSTLCGVKLGMILYWPAEDNERVEPTIWPENHEEIENLIKSYKKRSDDDCKQRTYDLSFFFKDQVKKVQEELAKTCKKNIETKYPTWDEIYDNLTYEGLKQFSTTLQIKIEEVKSRINSMKGAQITRNQNPMDAQSLEEESTYIYQSMLYYPQIIDGMANPMVMMPTNDGASSSYGSNYICNAENTYSNYKYGIGGDILVPHGVADQPLMYCYYPSLHPMPQYLQYPMLSSPPLQLQAANTEDYCQMHDFHISRIQYG